MLENNERRLSRDRANVTRSYVCMCVCVRACRCVRILKSFRLNDKTGDKNSEIRQ
jgi:hypothetical protein